MTGRAIDFQEAVLLDRKIVDRLDEYLQERENRLATQILNIVHPSMIESFSPVLPAGHSGLKLTDAVESFTKRIRSLTKNPSKSQSNGNVDRVIREINAAFWEFTEVLEGCSAELFQQIKQVNLDQWHVSLSHTVQLVKELLIHRIEDLIWTIRRLERPLTEYRRHFSVKKKLGWKNWFATEAATLDPELIINLTQSEKFLRSQYEEFHQRYELYRKSSHQVETYLEQMKSYPVLALLDIQDQNTYVDIFRLLKFWELNPHPKGLLGMETVRSLKNLTSIDASVKILKTYYRGLREAFFNSSLELKGYADRSKDLIEERKNIQGKLVNYRAELQHLISVINKYREFILKTDPNPYVRSRWGFPERPVAQEPVKAQRLMALIYKAEDLLRSYDLFLNSVGGAMKGQMGHSAHHTRQNIEKLLHEMGQPLISQSMMRNRAEKLLLQLKAFDEIGSDQQSAIDYVEATLSKAMREDWKYHVLHEFPLFHEIYRLHRGLQRYPKDHSHSFRIDRFKHLCSQIEEWVSQGDVYSHVHEIELDINDMKTYLQDFYATIQRADKEKSMDPFLDDTIDRFHHQLLEYRYIFGDFILFLIVKNQDSQQLRNQFLFVDQYFESIENLLNEMS